MNKPVVFLDADVIFAGAAAPTEHGASHVILRLGEITLIDCVTSTQVVTEVERNLAEKLPDKLPTLRLILSRSLRVVPDPEPQELTPYKGQADLKDLPILGAALQQGCRFLLTFNIRPIRWSVPPLHYRRSPYGVPDVLQRRRPAHPAASR